MVTWSGQGPPNGVAGDKPAGGTLDHDRTASQSLCVVVV